MAHRASHGLASLRAARALFPERTDSLRVPSAGVAVAFDNLQERLATEIRNAEAVFVAAGWLGDPQLLQALTECPHVGAIVTKDRMLRRGAADDPTTPAPHLATLRALQAVAAKRVRVGGLLPFDEGRLLLTSPKGEPVEWTSGLRCFGQVDHLDLHHKFVVFGAAAADGDGRVAYTPSRVWTGSFNFTRGSSGRCENAVIIDDPNVANAYLIEWCQLLSLSESVPFHHARFCPEWTLTRLDIAVDTLDD